MFCCFSDKKSCDLASAAGVEWTTANAKCDNPPSTPVPPYAAVTRDDGPQSLQSASTKEQRAHGKSGSDSGRQPPPRAMAEANLSIVKADSARSSAIASQLSCLSFLPCFKFFQPKLPMEMGTSSSVNAYSTKFFKSMSLSQFEVFLMEHGVPVELFGKNQTKTLEELFVEASTGACGFQARQELDNHSEATLLRTVATVLTELRAQINGEDKFLLMKDVTLASGVKRTYVNRRMAGRCMEGEDMIAMVMRAFKENLQLDQRSCKTHFDIESVHKEEEIRDSISYPGLPCVYKLLIAKVRVLHVSTPVLSHIGLPSGAEFQTKRTDIKGVTRRTWMWCSRIVFERAKKAISLDANKDETKRADNAVDSSPMGEDAAKALGDEIRAFAWQGRYANAHRALQSLETAGRNPHDFVDESIIEQVRRIVPVYAEARAECAKDLTLMEGYAWHDDLQAETAFVIKGKNFGLRISRYKLMDACDMPALLAAFCEFDMAAVRPQDYSMLASTPVRSFRRKVSLPGVPTAPAVERAYVEGQDDGSLVELPRSGGGWHTHFVCAVEIGRAFPSDTIWHYLAKHPQIPSIKTDNVQHCSIIDALDEPCRSVYVVAYTILNTDALGGQAPAVIKGYQRIPWSCLTYKCTPYKDGIRVMLMVEAEMSPTIAAIIKWLPTLLMKKLIKDAFKMISSDMDDFGLSNAPLRERRKVSARAPLYESIRKHITEVIDKGD